MKRSAVMEAGGYFIPELRNYTDWFTHLVMGFRHGICYFPGLSAAQRMTPGSYHQQEQKDIQKQIEVLDRMLHLLETDYRDVKPFFERTVSLSNHPTYILRATLGNPTYWSYISPRLLRHISSLDLLLDSALEPLRQDGTLDVLSGVILFNSGRLAEAREAATLVLSKRPDCQAAQSLLAKIPSQEVVLPDRTQPFLAQLNAVLDRSKQDPTALERVKRQLAEQWLNLPPEQLQAAYSSDLGRSHQKLLSNGLQEALSDREVQFVREVVTDLPQKLRDPRNIGHLLAAMLYCPPYRLPNKWYEGIPLPNWLL
ncbi:hypothetical protein HC928_21610, partial [bacterium]|nr:hypothetical protein [bacterium]